LIQPVRKESGHRLYTRKHIDQINRITTLTGQGMRISQIQPHMLEPEILAGDSADQRHYWRDQLNTLIEAIVSFDENKLEETYSEALSLYPINLVTRKLLRPLLIELGLRWEDQKGSIAEEHFFAFYLRNKLGARFHHRSRKRQGRKLLLAGLPGEHHEIALLLFALAADEQGFAQIVLGANMPFAELAQVAAKTDCVAIVLSGSVEPGKAILDKGLADLVENAAIPVFIGGQASVFAYDAINKAGAIALGNDLELGLQRLIQQLNKPGIA
jgi:DNA-binding transcriptional MerR regulator/methylmalonyl-CoA mutase cobalamin-binding subunit